MPAEHGYQQGYPSAEPTCRDMVKTADPDASSEGGETRLQVTMTAARRWPNS
jgi:hypothetical protein